jgi:hypothetical protein
MAIEAAGVGVDRSEIRRILALSPSDRVAELVEESRFLDQIDRATRVR